MLKPLVPKFRPDLLLVCLKRYRRKTGYRKAETNSSVKQVSIFHIFRLFQKCVEQKPLTLKQLAFGKGRCTQL